MVDIDIVSYVYLISKLRLVSSLDSWLKLFRAAMAKSWWLDKGTYNFAITVYLYNQHTNTTCQKCIHITEFASMLSCYIKERSGYG